MELQKLVNQVMNLRNQYEKKEKQLYGSPSTDEDIAQGLLRRRFVFGLRPPLSARRQGDI